MPKNTVSISLDQEALARFVRLLGDRPQATGVHCGDDGGDADGVVAYGALASGAHCGDDVDG